MEQRGQPVEPDPGAVVRARQVRLILFDVDGVLTDGSIVFDAAGGEVKVFNVRDGHGMRMAQRAGIEIGLLSGRDSLAVRKRAADLELDYVELGHHEKLSVARRLCSEAGLEPRQVAYMGDDVVDLPVMRWVGLAMAPPDAVDEVLEVAQLVVERPAGRGAAREAIEFILKAKDQWRTVMARYED